MLVKLLSNTCILIIIISKNECSSIKKLSSAEEKIPEGILLGVGSSSYQVEGAWNEDGKGESIMDHSSRVHPTWSIDGTNGDIACDAYHQTETDVQLLKQLGVDFYRFSISWVRILPTGDPTNVNQLGIDYYDRLINQLISNGIQPVVTIYHWELPQKLQELGGWTNRIIIDYFVDYAMILAKHFGDKVRWWVTFNEPKISSLFGYAQDNPTWPVFPPELKHAGVAEYLAVHHQLIAHSIVYSMFHSKFGDKVQVGLVLNVFNHRPITNETRNVEAADRMFLFDAGWVLDPLKFGDYPEVFKTRINANSVKEGRRKSRLPSFLEEEKSRFRQGVMDFIGLNYYTQMAAWAEEGGGVPSYTRDSGVMSIPDPEGRAHGVAWLKDEPKGLRSVLQMLKKRYDTAIFITENGCDDAGGFNDTARITYHQGHIQEILNAVKEDNVTIIGYTVWSFMDSFEWASGYSAKFGIYHVDFNDTHRKRSPKTSFTFFHNLFKNKILTLN